MIQIMISRKNILEVKRNTNKYVNTLNSISCRTKIASNNIPLIGKLSTVQKAMKIPTANTDTTTNAIFTCSAGLRPPDRK